MNHEVFAALGEALSRGEEAALVTIVSSNGSTPQRVGAKMLVFGDGRMIDEFRQRAVARLQLLPPHDPQFRRNRERVARDAEREHLILEWDLGEDIEE